jgi:hypothetical protein
MPETCVHCHARPVQLHYGAPICYLCYCNATGYGPEELAEQLATSEADYTARLTALRAELVPLLLAEPNGRAYWRDKGYAWAQEATDD